MSRSRLGKQAQEMFASQSEVQEPSPQFQDWAELNRAVWSLGQRWLTFWGLYPA